MIVSPAGGPPPLTVHAVPRAAGDGFGQALLEAAKGAAEAVRAGEAAGLAGLAGTMPLGQVVAEVMAAERSLQAAVAIRDKAVGAWQELSRMAI